MNTNRLGGFNSSLHYDRGNDVYYGLPDRGAGGGAYSYETRIQQFHIDTDLNTGAISNFVLQDPLAEEGGSNEGRRSRNTRLVEFDITTGQSVRQVIYQLDNRADVNAQIAMQNPDPAAALGATAQGRTLVISDMLALNDHEFLILERENRGIGSDNPSGADPILSASGLKHVYRIDVSGATDVSGISLKGTNALTTPVLAGNPDPPITIVPVTKTSFIDIRREILDAGLTLPEKIEGITFGPRLNNGLYAFIVGTDNDFSVTQAGTVVGGGGAILPVQYETYKNGTDVRFTPLDNTNITYVNILDAAGADYLVDQGPLPAGFEPHPSYLYSLAAIPEPSTGILAAVAGLALVVARYARTSRKRSAAASFTISPSVMRL